MNITATRAALATDVASVLRCTATVPDQINPPQAFVDAPSIVFDDDFDDDATVTFPLVVLVSSADSRSGQDKLDTLLPQIRDAVTPSLGGAVQSAQVIRVDGYGATHEVAGSTYIGATFLVEVLT